jgi:hypothetical protein
MFNMQLGAVCSHVHRVRFQGGASMRKRVARLEAVQAARRPTIDRHQADQGGYVTYSLRTA